MMGFLGFELIFVVVIVGGIVAYALGWRPQFLQPRLPQTSQSSEEILKARFARGEITREQFDEMKRVLGVAQDPAAATGAPELFLTNENSTTR